MKVSVTGARVPYARHSGARMRRQARWASTVEQLEHVVQVNARIAGQLVRERRVEACPQPEVATPRDDVVGDVGPAVAQAASHGHPAQDSARSARPGALCRLRPCDIETTRGRWPSRKAVARSRVRSP